MSFSNLARHFRRSRSKGSSGSSGTPHGDDSPHSSSRSGSVPLGTTAEAEDGLAGQTRVEMPTPMPSPWVASPPLTMPAPSMPAATAPSPMNGALADLTPLYGRLDAGPPVPREQKAMDTLGMIMFTFQGLGTHTNRHFSRRQNRRSDQESQRNYDCDQ